MANKLSLLEELKLRQKERCYRLEKKSEEESTPIKPSTSSSISPFLKQRKPNRKPSKAYQTSLSDIAASTDQLNKKQKNDHDHNAEDSSSSSFFSTDHHKVRLPTIKSGIEEEKYDNYKYDKYDRYDNDTMSIHTDSTYNSTTASIQSGNGRKKKKKKKKKKARVTRHGHKASISRSSDIPGITQSQHTPPHTPPQHPQMDVIDVNHIHNINMYDLSQLSVTQQLWSTNIFAFLCGIDVFIHISTLYTASVDLFIWTLVIYVVFQVITAVILSIFMNYERIKWILVILSVFLFIGNALYTHGRGISMYDTTDTDIVLVFIARAMCGISGSILINGYAINTLCSTILNREILIIIFRFITSIGMIMGPLCGILLCIVPHFTLSLFHITDTNIASFAIACLSMFYIVIFIIYLMYNYLIKTKKKNAKLDECTNDIANIHQKKGNNAYISSEEIIKRREYLNKYNEAVLYLSKNRKNHSLFGSKYVMLLLFLYISCLFTFWIAYAVIILNGYNDYNSYYAFGFIVVLYILSFLMTRCLNHRFRRTSLDKRVIIAINIQIIGYFLLTKFGVKSSITLVQLICALCLIVMGFAIGTLQIPAIFCLITGTKLRNIGIRISWFFMVSSIVRIIAPIFAWFLIKNENGSIDLLSHLSAFYLFIISFFALVIVMEANKNTAFFSSLYYTETQQRQQQQKVVESEGINIVTLHSERKQYRTHAHVHRVPSRSVTPYSQAKVDEYEDIDPNDSDEYVDNKENKKHFNYSPVHKTESTESIPVSFKPKKTFTEKYNTNELELYDVGDSAINNNNNNNNDLNSKRNILQKIKTKSSRLSQFLKKDNENKKEKKINKTAPNVQSPDIGLKHYQL